MSEGLHGSAGGGPIDGGMPADNTGIWLDAAARPRQYNELDWVNAQSLLHPIVELANPRGDETVVDIGTGTGAVARYVAPYVGRVIGVDVSAAMLAQAELAPNMTTMQGDVRTGIALPDGYADIVTTRMMLHDLADPIGAIEEAWRLVQPGGKLIASEYVTDICTPQAIAETDAYEAARRDSSLLLDEFFGDPSDELLAFHRFLFGLKQEPDRYLWTAANFEKMFVATCGNQGTVTMSRSLTPFNSIGNWLGKSGFGLAVKQEGLIACMLTVPHLLGQKAGLTITVDGQPIDPKDLGPLAYAYIQADPEAREAMGVDAKMHRVFANVMVHKWDD